MAGTAGNNPNVMDRVKVRILVNADAVPPREYNSFFIMVSLLVIGWCAFVCRSYLPPDGSRTIGCIDLPAGEPDHPSGVPYL
jgi:hypothetical protein